MARNLSELMYVCKILSPHGVHGDFRVELLSDDVKRLENLRCAYLVHPKDEKQRLETIVSLNGKKAESLILHCDRIATREEVGKYRFWYIAVTRENARELPEGEYFVCDLIGCRVVDEKYGELGTVRDILDQAGQMIYEIEKEGQALLYFPALASVILDTDLEAGLIRVALPDGLYEVYRG